MRGVLLPMMHVNDVLFVRNTQINYYFVNKLLPVQLGSLLVKPSLGLRFYLLVILSGLGQSRVSSSESLDLPQPLDQHPYDRLTADF